MPERTWVHQPTARKGGDRGVAEGVQQGTAEEGTGWSAAVSLCQTDGHEISYINPGL